MWSAPYYPLVFNTNLELIVDPQLLENDELFFNAARLDRSLALNCKDYVAIAKPRLENIFQQDEVSKQKHQMLILSNMFATPAHIFWPQRSWNCIQTPSERLDLLLKTAFIMTLII